MAEQEDGRLSGEADPSAIEAPGINLAEQVMPSAAEEVDQEVKPSMPELLAALVRERSKSQAKLTPLDSLEMEGAPVDRGRQDAMLEAVLSDENCGDLVLLRTTAGRAFLYSTAHMSETYARILLRVEEDNPYETIASTVREESELYPRPTPLAQFLDPTFGLDPSRIERLAREMIQLEQYGDIKLVEASTGPIYLYSSRHLDADWAKSLVEWEEVGRRENP